jgi:hypothetical protein
MTSCLIKHTANFTFIYALFSRYVKARQVIGIIAAYGSWLSYGGIAPFFLSLLHEAEESV